MNPEHIERLSNLLRVAEEFRHEPQVGMDMSGWCGKKCSAASVEDYVASPAPSLTDCGTTLCLGGRAGLDPWFREQGWQLSSDGICIHGVPAGVDAIARFFGIMGLHAITIFFTSNVYDDAGVSKEKTLDKLVDRIKLIALVNYEVTL